MGLHSGLEEVLVNMRSYQRCNAIGKQDVGTRGACELTDVEPRTISIEVDVQSEVP
jgi:hypothetical protein